jgi:hypothetical protein
MMDEMMLAFDSPGSASIILIRLSYPKDLKSEGQR